MLELMQRNQLSYHIRWIICYINLSDFNDTLKYILTIEVKSDINMFGSRMIHLIYNQMFGALAITKHNSVTLLQTKIIDQTL